MNGLFINYRREDTAPYAGRLYDLLRRALPDKRVFMDIDAIDPGEDFVEAINQTLAHSEIVVVVIGPNWTKVTDSSGSRRLDNPEDYVVRELSAALNSAARIIPILVGGASMPLSESLPAPLRALCRKNAIEISDTRFLTDAERLVAAIGRVKPGESAGSPQSQTEQSQSGSVDSDLADAMTTFKTLLWTGYALTIPSLFFQARRPPEIPEGLEIGFTMWFIMGGIIALGFSAWFNIMLVRGKNWARMAYIALIAITSPALFLNIEKQPAAEIALNVVSLLLAAWLIRLMFTNPVRKTFTKMLPARSRR